MLMKQIVKIIAIFFSITPVFRLALYATEMEHTVSIDDSTKSDEAITVSELSMISDSERSQSWNQENQDLAKNDSIDASDKTHHQIEKFPTIKVIGSKVLTEYSNSASSSVTDSSPNTLNSTLAPHYPSIRETVAQNSNNGTPLTVSVHTISDNKRSNDQTPTLAINMDHLPHLEKEIITYTSGSMITKAQGRDENSKACNQALETLKYYVDKDLKRSVYKSVCELPEFSRLDSEKIEYKSKAVITFY